MLRPMGRCSLKTAYYKHGNGTGYLCRTRQNKCNGCRICVDFCKFSALAYVKDRLRVSQGLLSWLGLPCFLCPQGALKKARAGLGGLSPAYQGIFGFAPAFWMLVRLRGVPIIRHMMETLTESEKVVIDCPPEAPALSWKAWGCGLLHFWLLNPQLGILPLEMVYKLVKLFGNYMDDQ